jgi:hypothetical protein
VILIDVELSDAEREQRERLVAQQDVAESPEDQEGV